MDDLEAIHLRSGARIAQAARRDIGRRWTQLSNRDRIGRWSQQAEDIAIFSNTQNKRYKRTMKSPSLAMRDLRLGLAASSQSYFVETKDSEWQCAAATPRNVPVEDGQPL